MLRKILKSKTVRYTLWAMLAWLVIHITFITIDGHSDYKGSADVAVILGNRVFADGSLSTWLQGRTDAALALYQQKRIKKIFASGGISRNDQGNYPEGDAMKEYLVRHGVRPEDVIVDNQGVNTYWTAKNFSEWSNANPNQSVIVVSQFYHITRTKYIFRKVGVKGVHSVSSESYSLRDVVGTLREVPAFYKYLVVY